jgi:hypothetical protein
MVFGCNELLGFANFAELSIASKVGYGQLASGTAGTQGFGVSRAAGCCVVEQLGQDGKLLAGVTCQA